MSDAVLDARNTSEVRCFTASRKPGPHVDVEVFRIKMMSSCQTLIINQQNAVQEHCAGELMGMPGEDHFQILYNHSFVQRPAQTHTEITSVRTSYPAGYLFDLELVSPLVSITEYS